MESRDVTRQILGIIGGLVMSGLVIGCVSTSGTLPPATPSPSPSVSTSPSTAASPSESSGAFRSDRYGYALELPTGWSVRMEAPGMWTPNEIGYVGAGTDAFEEDYEQGDRLDFPGITYGLYVSAFEPKEAPTVEAWTDTLAATMNSDSSCQGAPEREDITIDGEAAIALVYDRTDCTHDHHVVVVGVLHGSMGYNLMWLAKRGEDDARRATFDSILQTFEWTH